MKVIITEQQQKNIIHWFIEDSHHNIGKLKKRPTKSMSFGRGYKYFDPQTKDVLFHVVSGGPVFWEKGGGTRPAYPGVRLYVDRKLYDELKDYFGNVDEQLLKWFNQTYKQDADRVIGGIKQ
jgi:hypothetical protein